MAKAKALSAKALPEPTAALIKTARLNASLTQAQAAELIYLRDIMRWSDYEREKSVMPLANWELFLLKTGQRDLVVTTGGVE